MNKQKEIKEIELAFTNKNNESAIVELMQLDKEDINAQIAKCKCEIEKLVQERKSKQNKKVIQSSQALRKKEWPSEKEQRYKQIYKRYYSNHQKVNQKDYKEITRCKLHLQARDTRELNVLEAKTPSILEIQLNNKKESKDKHGKLEDILEEEILDT